MQFFRPDAPRLAAVFGLMLVSIGLNLVKPWPWAIIVDSVLGSKSAPAILGQWSQTAEGRGSLLLLLCGLMLVVTLIQGGLSAVQNFLAIQVGLRGLRRVRNEVFACLQRLSLRFHQGSKTGDLIYRAAWDTYSFQTLFQQGVITMLSALVTLVLMVLVMARLDWLLTLVAVATIPLIVVVIKVFGKKMTERGVAAQQADSQVTSLVQQSIAALPLIQSYTREEHEQAQFTEQTATAQDKRLTQHTWELVYWLAITVVFGLGTAGIVWFGSRRVMSGHLSVGDLIIFLTYLGQLYDPLNQLSHVGATISTASAGTQRVFELLDTPEEVKDAPNARAVTSDEWRVMSEGRVAGGEGLDATRNTQHALPEPLIVQGMITFANVSFSYQKEKPVLQGLNFQIPPGKCAAIIGPSGVGKTTLMNLLPRFFDPVSGAVKLDGVDLRELRVHDLRAQIAVVLQEPILLPTTIAENIAYGCPGATPEQIAAAARAANAHIFIEKLPAKYQTMVGDGAARLSVGERQRVNIARAFLKNAPILLLDEPTSALERRERGASGCQCV